MNGPAGVMAAAMEDAAEALAGLEALSRRVDTPMRTPEGAGTLAWRIWGDGANRHAPLVLAHGAQGAWSHWARNIETLAQERLVIAVDLPGHGDSADPAEPSHEAISQALAEGLRTILGDAVRADLCGFSFGGVALAHLAALQPGIARRLVLVGCGGLGTPRGEVDLQRVSGLAGAVREARLKANLLGLMLHHEDSVDALALHMLVANARKARLAVPELVIPDRLLRILPQVPVAVDAIWGERDRPHPDPVVQETALRGIQPDLTFHVVADAGHWAMYERPRAFDAALLSILSAPPRQPS